MCSKPRKHKSQAKYLLEEMCFYTNYHVCANYNSYPNDNFNSNYKYFAEISSDGAAEWREGRKSEQEKIPVHRAGMGQGGDGAVGQEPGRAGGASGLIILDLKLKVLNVSALQNDSFEVRPP